MNYALLFENLQKHNVRYVICGGLAVNLHGIPRMTADVDIILDLTEQNLNLFQQSVAELNYKISIPVQLKDVADEAIRKKLKIEKNLIAISFYNPDKDFLALDVLIDFPIEFESLWENKIVKKEGNININLVGIDQLIQLKEYANRVQDKQDIHYLSKIKDEKK